MPQLQSGNGATAEQRLEASLLRIANLRNWRKALSRRAEAEACVQAAPEINKGLKANCSEASTVCHPTRSLGL
jgi:hypothetical protein